MSQQLFEPGTKVRFTGPQLIEFAKRQGSTHPAACIDMLCQYIESAQPVIRPWIPMSAAAPPEGQIVLIAGAPEPIALYRSGRFYTGETECSMHNLVEFEITHWMPIPEAPA